MKIVLGIFLGLGVTILATVGIGDKITAKRFNNSTFQIGDIKQSILSQDEFVLIHGDCWKQMNTNIDLLSTDLGDHIVNAGFRIYDEIPDASGRVLRLQGSGSAILGSTQEDATSVNELNVNNDNSLSGSFRIYVDGRTSVSGAFDIDRNVNNDT